MTLLRYPSNSYVVMSDRDDKVLSSATTVKEARKLRKVFEDSMGQGVTVKIYKIEELSEIVDDFTIRIDALNETHCPPRLPFGARCAPQRNNEED